MALLIGSKGKRVKDLQSKLSKILNKAIAIDGHFGQNTKRLVEQFQRNFGLTVDGVVGPITQKKINGMYSMLFVTNNDLMTFGKERFVVFVDAGHGGVVFEKADLMGQLKGMGRWGRPRIDRQHPCNRVVLPDRIGSGR